MLRDLVSLSGDTALIHFGTIVRFPRNCAIKALALYAVGASEDDKDALVRMAEIVRHEPDFMFDRWMRRPSFRRDNDKLIPEQHHLHIALVTDLQAPARYTATTIDSEVSL